MSARLIRARIVPVSAAAAAIAAIAAGPLLVPARPARAQATYNYVGLGTGAWSEGKSWDIGKPPESGAGARLVFSGKPTAADTVNDLGVFTLSQMYFAPDAGGFTVAGDPLSFVAYAGVAPTLYNDSASSITLANDIALLNSIAVGGAGDLRLTGALSGGGGLSKVGAGTLYLSGPKASSSIGGLYVGGGALVIDGGSRVSATSGAYNQIDGSLTVDGAGSSFFGYVERITGAVSVTNGGLLSTGISSGDPTGYYLDFTPGGGSLTVTGQGSRWVNELTDVYLYRSDAPPVSLTISDGGAGEIGGRLILQRGATVTVDRGTLAVSSLLDAGTAASAGSFIAISDAPGGGSALTLRGSGNDGYDGFNGLINDAAGGPGSITVAAGSWTLNNAANTYSGGTYLNGGTLNAQSGGVLGTGGLFFNGGSLYIRGDATFGTDRPVTFGSKGGTLGSRGGGTLTIAQDLVVNSPLTIAGGTVKLTGVNAFTAPINLSIGTLALVSDVDQTLGVTVSGDGSLYKGGSSTLTLTQATAGIRGATVDGGALRLQNGDALYRGLLTLNKNDGVILDFADSAPLRIGGLSGSGNLALGAHPLILGAENNGSISGTQVYSGSISGIGGVTINYATVVLTGKSTYTGGTILDRGGSLYLRTDSLVGDISSPFGKLYFDQNTDGTFAGRLSGDLEVYKYGTGTIRLPNAALTQYRIYGGTLEAPLAGDSIRIYNGATFRALSGGNIRSFEAENTVATIDTNGFDVVAQYLFPSSGSLPSYVKTGAGTLSALGLATAESIDLRGGALELGRSPEFYQGHPALRTPARLTIGDGTELRGSAWLVNGVTLNAGGTISPGRQAVPREAGIFDASSLVWNDGGVLRYDLNTDGTGDLITLSSAFTKGTTGAGGYFFDFSGSSLTDGMRYTLVGLADTATTNFTASDFKYRGLSGDSGGAFEMDASGLYFRAFVSSAATPEPPALGLLLALSPAAVVAVRVARRRRAAAE